MCIPSSHRNLQLVHKHPTPIHQQSIQIDWDDTSPSSPTGLAVSFKRAANIAMSCCAITTTLGLVIGGLALKEYLSSYSLREITNAPSELEIELWEVKQKYQRLALNVGTYGGFASGIATGIKLAPCLGIPQPIHLFSTGIIGLYIGLITGFILM